jgi:hypothetical protein
MALLVGLSERFYGLIRSFPLFISFHRGSPCLYISWGWTIDTLLAAAQRRNLNQSAQLINKSINSSPMSPRRSLRVGFHDWNCVCIFLMRAIYPARPQIVIMVRVSSYTFSALLQTVVLCFRSMYFSNKFHINQQEAIIHVVILGVSCSRLRTVSQLLSSSLLTHHFSVHRFVMRATYFRPSLPTSGSFLVVCPSTDRWVTLITHGTWS